MPAPTDGPSLGRSLLRRWPLVLTLVLLGAGTGVFLGTTRPTTYAAENRLVVGGQDLAAQAIPGFAQASKEIASNYARFVTTTPVVQALEPAVGAEVLDVSASPVPDSNVLRIEAHATTPGSASAAAATARKQLLRQVTKLVSAESPEKTLAAYDELSRNVVAARQVEQDAQAKVDELKAKIKNKSSKSRALVAARRALTDATTTRQALELRQSALSGLYQQQLNRGPAQNGLTSVDVTRVTGNDRLSKLELLGVVGAAWGLFAAAVLAWLLERRRRVRTSVSERGEAPVVPQHPQAPVPVDDRVVDVRQARGRRVSGGAPGSPDDFDRLVAPAVQFQHGATRLGDLDGERAAAWPVSR